MAKGEPRWKSLSRLERIEKKWKHDGASEEQIERWKELYKKHYGNE